MMHHSIPKAPRRFPIGKFRAGIATMVALILLSTLLSWRLGEHIRSDTTSQIEVATAAQRLEHHGTVLEMAIKAVAAHGDPEAAAKYRTVQPELRATLNQLRKDLDSPQDEISATQVDRADLALTAMEYQALELARAGRLEDAQRIVNSPRYDNLVAVYREGIQRIEDRAAAHVRGTQSDLELHLWINIALSAASLLLVLVGWVAFVRPARSWGDDLESARGEAELAAMQLREKQQELEGANKRLFKQARVDPLTALHTRLKFNEDVQKRWLGSDPSPHSYCAIMCDIDFFKQYNDTHGHLAGDRALRLVADALGCVAGPDDGLYRLGGEEFLMVSKVASAAAAAALAERLRKAVEAMGIAHGASPHPTVTASFGVSLLPREGKKSIERWLSEADAALYKAKSAGRNQVAVAAAETADT